MAALVATYAHALKRPADALSAIAQFRAGQREEPMKLFSLIVIAGILSASARLKAYILSHLALMRWRRRLLNDMRSRSRQ